MKTVAIAAGLWLALSSFAFAFSADDFITRNNGPSQGWKTVWCKPRALNRAQQIKIGCASYWAAQKKERANKRGD